MSDYCTLWPDRIPGTQYDWSGCCADHDDHYEIGDTTFSEANDYLWFCVRRKGFVKLADVMWWGVTIFGWPFWIYYRVKKWM